MGSSFLIKYISLYPKMHQCDQRDLFRFIYNYKSSAVFLITKNLSTNYYE